MKIGGYARQHYGKHSGMVGKTSGTSSREQRQKRGLLGVGGEKVNGICGRILVGFERTTDQDVLNQVSIFYRYWRGDGHDMHIETEGKHLGTITSELTGVGEISKPV